MRAYTNEHLIQRRARLGKYASWGGLAVLAVGMVLSFRANPANASSYQISLMGSFFCLIAGFILANIGSLNMRRFGRRPRPDERLTKELKGFDDRYVLFNWVLPAAYVFMGPSGIYAFAVREQGGKVSNNGSRWSQSGGMLRFLAMFSGDGIGNPTSDAIEDAGKVQKYLQSVLPDAEIEVQPLALFTNPNVQLELNNPAIPVVQSKGLKALMRQRSKDHRLDDTTLREIESAFQVDASLRTE
jgi:hypothetical protein